MKYRAFRSRLSTAAPKMTVRSHVPLSVKLAVGIVVVAAAAAAGYALAKLAASRGEFASAQAEMARLADENRTLAADHDRLVEFGNTIDSRRVMEASTIRELGDQIARLEADNARLKEDVAFFEAATADRGKGTTGDNGGIAMRRLQVVVEKDGSSARYRILLTQDSKANRDFTGTLQLSIVFIESGKPVNILLPQAEAGVGEASNYEVSFRSYKRIDGSFAVPAGATLKSVQVRILERGVVRVQQTAAPSTPGE